MIQPMPVGRAEAARQMARQQRATFLRDVFQGLSQSPKTLPCKYFYDQRGAELFDAICELDEYYVTRVELSIMRRFAAQIAARIDPHATLIEFGSGSSVKTEYLLDALPMLPTYIPIDISGEHLQATAKKLRLRYRHLTITPLTADFTQALPLSPPEYFNSPRVVYFPGSTIGNFEIPQAHQLLQRISTLIGPRGGLIIGIDLQKDIKVLEAAYNDRQGVTAAFNGNLLSRINRELGGTFRLETFTHRATYNEDLHRMELRLRCDREQWVHIGDQSFKFERNESILTEYSHKYTVDQFAAMAAEVGLGLKHRWLDDHRYFAVLYFEKLR